MPELVVTVKLMVLAWTGSSNVAVMNGDGGLSRGAAAPGDST